MAYGSILGQMPPTPDMEANNISYDNTTSQESAPQGEIINYYVPN